MSRDLPVVVGIAAAWSGAVGLAGLLLLRRLRHGSLSSLVFSVAVVSVLATVAGVVGTAQAMFFSPHDYQVALLVCVVAGLVGIGLALVLAGQVLAGTRALTDAVKGMGEHGAFHLAARPPTAELAMMAEELERASRRQQESRAREEALEASRRELVAWVSHDLRTPLAGLRAMAEALEDGVAASPARYHAQMRLEVERLAGMVDDLFELSRIHAGALNLSLEPVSLEDVVSDTLSGADALAQARGVRLRGRAEHPLPVHADAGELSRALTNLVVNAIRHTPGDSAVDVVAERSGDAAVLAVTDACGGIPEADLDRVFDVAWRGTDARTPGPQGGAGLGLAIVRGIVEAHRGSVDVANTGGGCRFEVRLPIASPSS